MKIEFAVQMTCESCVEKVQKALSGLDGISKLDVDLQSNTVMVDTDLPQSLIKDKIEATGMRAVLRGYGQLGAAVAMLGGNTGFSSGNIKELQLNMVSEVKALPPLLVNGDGDAADAWKLWLQRFTIFLRANGHDNAAPEKQVAMFLHLIGEECLHIFNSFGLNDKLDNKSLQLEEVISKFTDHFVPKKNLTYVRHKFFTRDQQEGESVENYVAVLNKMSYDCEFEKLREDLVKDILIVGMRNVQVKERLLREDNLDLDKAVRLCKTAEITSERMKTLDSATTPVKGVKEEPVYYVQRSNVEKPRNTPHGKNRVFSCYRCGEPGHYANRCRRGRQQNRRDVNVCTREVEDEEDVLEKSGAQYFVGVLGRNGWKSSDWYETLAVNNIQFKSKIDTGAQVNVLPVNLLLQLGLSYDIIKKNANIKLKTLSGTLPVIGTVLLRCYVGKAIHLIEFVVVQVECTPLLGLPTCKELDLVQRKTSNYVSVEAHSIQSDQNNSIVDKYNDVFSGVGKVNCKPFHIKLRENATPKIDATRKVPFGLYKPLKEELQRMEELGIIEKVNAPTDWVNSLVITKKKNGKLRTCLDPRHLNKFIVKPHFTIPTVEDIFSRLHGAKHFSVLDCSSSFWMVPIDEESSNLCVFATPFGRYRYLRLPFGLNVSSEVFQNTISSIFENEDGVEPYIDDIIIFGKTKEEHDGKLEKVLEIARVNNIRFNPEKCIFNVSKVKFLGHVIDENGIHIDDEKVKAIMNLPAPTNRKELERFLGSMNYLAKFIQNYSSRSSPIRDLLNKNSLWIWDENHEKCFQELKNCISNAPVLKFFDVNKDVTLSVDSSSYGIGCVLLQNEQPVAFSSRALNSSQKNYAQVEKEMMAILVGCLKFHKYIFNTKVIVETDHKALESLFKKPLAQVPARIQRMMLKIQAYDLEVKYVPGKYLYLADMLSRAPLSLEETSLDNDEIIDIDHDVICQVDLVHKNVCFSSEKLAKLKEETGRDVCLSKLKVVVKEGWPQDKKLVDPELVPFWNFRDEINIIDDILFKVNAVIVPKSMQKEALQKAHEGHLGAQYCINRVKDKVYWPNIFSQIKDLCTSCFTCNVHKDNNTKEEIMFHDVYEIPWYKVGVDMFEFNGKHYVLVVDYYSKFIETALCSNTSSAVVIAHIKSIFARHGIPQIVVSDNGPQFSSREFQQFARTYEFQHITSSPRYPRSNGEAESAVKIMKKMLTKCLYDNTDPYIGMLNLRNTPKNFGPSPAQLLFSRVLNSKIPTQNKLLKPKIYKYDENYVRYRNSQETYYNKGAKNLEPLKVDQRVFFKKREDDLWTPGVISSTLENPRSYNVMDEEGHEYRRNRVHISPLPQCSQHQDSQSPGGSSTPGTPMTPRNLESPGTPTTPRNLTSPESPITPRNPSTLESPTSSEAYGTPTVSPEVQVPRVIRFVQEDDRHCIVDGEIDAPRDTPLSVSIYECGDISNNCANLGDKLVAILDHQNIAPNKETGSILYKLIGKNDSNGKETANILDKFIGTNNSNGKLTKNASGQTVINNERSDTCCSRTNKSENSRNSNLLAGNGGPFNTVNRIGANAESTRENGSQSNALNGASIQAPPSTLTERKSVHGPISDQSSTQTPPTSSVGPMSDENSQAPPTSLILKTRSPIDISGIVGRSLVIEDGANNRLACAVIARSAGVTENKKVICACDGVTIWEERERPLAGPGRRGK
ncbi:hypothetical protein M8J77_019339 [Diaphorina citri]|nr:hypothetical protein M8J77_019339 [Diaphorina citri]